MAKEKINDYTKRQIANGNFKGKQFDVVASLTGVCTSTARKADKIGKLLNENDYLKSVIRQKEVQNALLKNNLILRRGKYEQE